MQLSPNTLLQGGKYKIISALGQGGFGITYLAEQTMMDRKVCIKEFFLKEYCDRDEQTSAVSLGTTNNRALLQKYQEKFLKEARMIARLDHPNIIRIHDVFTENNTAYYVTDYIEGQNLNDVVKAGGALPEGQALKYVRAVGEGLSYVHGKKITHLDVKPGNIMVRESDGRPVLIDFGMSKQYDEVGEQTSSTPIGVSAGYAPLEQYQSGGVTEFSPQTDVYALAATLYRLVTGQVPPSASDVMNEGLPEMPPAVSAQTQNAIGKGMEFRKKDRPATVEAFLGMLGEGSAPESPADVTSSSSAKSSSPSAVESDGQTTIYMAPQEASETEIIDGESSEELPDTSGDTLESGSSPSSTQAMNDPAQANSVVEKTRKEIEAEKFAAWQAKHNAEKQEKPNEKKSRKGWLIACYICTLLGCVMFVCGCVYFSWQGNVSYESSFAYLGWPAVVFFTFSTLAGFIVCAKSRHKVQFILIAAVSLIGGFISIVETIEEANTYPSICVSATTTTSSTSTTIRLSNPAYCYVSFVHLYDVLSDTELACNYKKNGVQSIEISDLDPGTAYKIEIHLYRDQEYGIFWHCARCYEDDIKFVTTQQLGKIAEVKINDISVDHNVISDGKYGMKIHIDFTVEGAQYEEYRCALYYYNSDSYYALDDLNGAYRTEDGHVSCGKDFTTYCANSTYQDFEMFMPYEELHSTGNFYFNVNFYRKYDSKFCSAERTVYFTYK